MSISERNAQDKAYYGRSNKTDIESEPEHHGKYTYAGLKKILSEPVEPDHPGVSE